jgi:hypothetical protein
MELVLPQLRRSKIIRPRGERQSRKMAMVYKKSLAITVREGKVRGASGGLTAGISGGHKGLGEGCFRAMPTRSDR